MQLHKSWIENWASKYSPLLHYLITYIQYNTFCIHVIVSLIQISKAARLENNKVKQIILLKMQLHNYMEYIISLYLYYC